MRARSPRRRSTLVALTVALCAIATVLVPVAPAGAAPVGDAQDPARPQLDFDGNGQADAYWYAPGPASDSVWRHLGGSKASTTTPLTGKYDVIYGDFDGDLLTDLFLYAPGPEPDYIWWSNGNDFTSASFPMHGHYEPVAGDFDGDGNSDVFLYAPGPARDYMWLGSGNRATPFVGHDINLTGKYEPIVGDFNSDERSDIFLYGLGTDPDYLWTSTGTGTTFSSVARPVSGRYAPLAGDFDGDDDTDIFWYAPGVHADSIWFMQNGNIASSKPMTVNGTYLPMVGDFDGNDRSDIFWYAPGPAADSKWMAVSSNSVGSVAETVNGRYQPVSSVTPPPPVLEPARPGDRSPNVARLQQKLLSLNFWVPAADGYYGEVTQQAVMAFQKSAGISRDGVAGPETVARMMTAAPVQARYGGNHVEVSISKQLMYVVKDGKTYVFNTSTGRAGWETPTGNYRINREINGMRHAPLGQLWRPKYFNGGIAMHGSPSIPGYPASHGCTRLHDTVINFIWDAPGGSLAPVGTPVNVYA